MKIYNLIHAFLLIDHFDITHHLFTYRESFHKIVQVLCHLLAFSVKRRKKEKKRNNDDM